MQSRGKKEEKTPQTRTYKGHTFLCDEDGDVKSSLWMFLVWQESAAPDWMDNIGRFGFLAAVSPLHNRDIDDDGQPKKAHWHVLLKWANGTTTYNNALRWAKRIYPYVEYIEPCVSPRGTVRYHYHLDNPEKFQYSLDEGRSFGGLDILDIINSASDDLLELKYVYAYIKANAITSYNAFVDFCSAERPQWFRLINIKYRENIFKYIRAQEYEYKQAAKGLTQEHLDQLQQQLQQLRADLDQAKVDKAAMKAKLDMLQK